MGSVNSSKPHPVSWILRVREHPYFNPIMAIFTIVLLVLASGLIYRVYRLNPYPYWLKSTDFGLYIQAARDINEGRDPYIPPACPCPEVYGTTKVHDQVAYPPLFLEFLIPFALIGDEFTRVSWLILSMALTAVAVAITLAAPKHKVSLISIGIITGIIALSHIGRSDFYHGQTNYLLMFLITFGLWLRAKNKTIAAGLSIGLAVAIKPFLGLLTCYFLWKRDYKTAFFCVATTIILVLLSFVPLVRSNGISAVYSWRAASSYFASGDMATRPDNLSLHALALRIFSDNLYTIPWVNNTLVRILVEGALVLGALTVFTIVVPRRSAGITIDEDPHMPFAEVGLFLGLSMVIGPLTEDSHLLLLIPGAISVLYIAIKYATRQSETSTIWQWVIGAWSIFFFFLASPLSFVRPGLPSSDEWTPLTGASILLTGTTIFFLLGINLLFAEALRRERKVQCVTKV
jgi:hypothetical protein